MSHVKINQAVGGCTQVEIDGHPLKDVTRVQMDFPADDIVKVHLGVAVTKPFEWEGSADVALHLHVPEGCRMIEVTTHGDAPGTKRWIVTKITPVLLLLLLSAPAFAQRMTYTVARPSTPDEAAAIFQRSHPPIEFPVVYEGPTVTFTGATSPSLGPWDNFAVRSSIEYGNQVAAYGLYPRYARGRHLPLRAWQSQDWRRRVHVLAPARPQRSTSLGPRTYHSGSGLSSTVQRPRNVPRLQRRVPEHLLRRAPSQGGRPSAADVARERRERRSADPRGRAYLAVAHQR